MFYNSQLISKSSFNNNNKGNNIKSPVNAKKILQYNHRKLLKMQENNKMNNLLLIKYLKQIGIKNPEITLKDELNNELKGEKIQKENLNHLHQKITQILKNKLKTRNKSNPELKISKTEEIPKEKITNELPQISNPQTITTIINNPKTINSPKEIISNNSLENSKISPTEPKKIITSLSSNDLFSPKRKRRKFLYITPEEELAKLEAEFAKEESKKSPVTQKLDFSSEGNEWVAIANYNRKLYEEQLIEEREKEKNKKKLTKLFLDEQIKLKIQKENEEKIKENELSNFLKNQYKNLEILYKQKEEEKRQRFLSEQKIREKQIQEKNLMKRINELKEKKMDNEIISNIKQEIENDKKMLLERKKMKDEVYKKILLINEANQRYKNEQKKLNKQENIRFLEETEKVEAQRELIRKKILTRGKSVDQYKVSDEVKKIWAKMRDEIKEEDEKYLKYIIEQEKLYQIKQEKEKKKKIEEKIELKKYLDLQVKAKKKENEFRNIIDKEQGRVWDMDYKKFIIDQKEKELKIKKTNCRINNILMEQIKNKKEKEMKKDFMSGDEYSLNKKLLEKVKEKLSK